MLIVGIGGGGGHHDQFTLRTQLLLGYGLQPFSDTRPLIFFIDRQIGNITGIVEIRQGSGDTDEPFTIPRGDRQIAVLYHALHACPIINRPALTEGGLT
ncbi:MAG: hypothetical protein P8Z00_14365 [Anaerolineales bacterium]